MTKQSSDFELYFSTARELRQKFEDRDLSAVEATRAMLNRIESLAPEDPENVEDKNNESQDIMEMKPPQQNIQITKPAQLDSDPDEDNESVESESSYMTDSESDKSSDLAGIFWTFETPFFNNLILKFLFRDF